MHHHGGHMHHPLQVSLVDPHVVETLKCNVGNYVVLETTRGGIDGCIADVKSDHVVLDARGKKFYVRICEIVWIMPK
ncbi:DUF2642 domain-containing protein [Paenibacillus fonticola]|uniref:DUF2642 domain-containing protein n=1 Tax=Paenibacillus fonticola TaxID=379896 RepID=UPI0003A44CF5|nr:DUF2642 domain-containing protein [Paenibacillus fonticola]